MPADDAPAAAGFEPTGLATWLQRRALRAPERPVLTFGDRTWSYGEFQAWIESLSDILAARGVGRGDRVAWLGFNHPAMLATMVVCIKVHWLARGWRGRRMDNKAGQRDGS